MCSSSVSVLSSPFVVSMTLTLLLSGSMVVIGELININLMFRGSSYSMQTERDLSMSGISEENIKIAMVGNSEVGKSSIINCIEKESFNEDIDPTVAFRLRFKKIKINRHLIVNLTIWDASGFKLPHYIKEGKLRRFDGIFYVYDLTNTNSVLQLEQLHDQIIKHSQSEEISMVVGNKADLAVVRDPKTKQYHIPSTNQAFYLGSKFSERNKMLHQNVSAKINTHVTDIFVLMITEILNKKRKLRISRLGDDEDSFHFQDEDEAQPKCKICQQCQLM